MCIICNQNRLYYAIESKKYIVTDLISLIGMLYVSVFVYDFIEYRLEKDSTTIENESANHSTEWSVIRPWYFFVIHFYWLIYLFVCEYLSNQLHIFQSSNIDF